MIDFFTDECYAICKYLLPLSKQCFFPNLVLQGMIFYLTYPGVLQIIAHIIVYINSHFLQCYNHKTIVSAAANMKNLMQSRQREEK